MKLEIEKRLYQAGEVTTVSTRVWEVTPFDVDGEQAVPLSPGEIAELVDAGQMLYRDDQGIVRLTVLRSYGL
jgi:hypothetical protein